MGNETPLPEFDSAVIEDEGLRLSYVVAEDERVPVYLDADMDVKYRLENGDWTKVLSPEAIKVQEMGEYIAENTESIISETVDLPTIDIRVTNELASNYRDQETGAGLFLVVPDPEQLEAIVDELPSIYVNKSDGSEGLMSPRDASKYTVVFASSSDDLPLVDVNKSIGNEGISASAFVNEDDELTITIQMQKSRSENYDGSDPFELMYSMNVAMQLLETRNLAMTITDKYLNLFSFDTSFDNTHPRGLKTFAFHPYTVFQKFPYEDDYFWWYKDTDYYEDVWDQLPKEFQDSLPANEKPESS